MEELCSCAVKEEQVEMKLGAVIAQWGSTDFTFGDFKTHGAVILKVRLFPCIRPSVYLSPVWPTVCLLACLPA